MSKKLKDFSRLEIYDFVIEYALSPLCTSLEECAKSYGISQYMAKKLVYKAISDCIVDDNVVDILADKAQRSASKHAYDEGICQAPFSTYQKYQSLKEERKNFTIPQEDGIKLVIEYAASPLSKETFCEKNAISKTLFDRTFVQVISNCLVADDIVKSLYRKAFEASRNPYKVNKLFEKLWKARKQFQKSHL